MDSWDDEREEDLAPEMDELPDDDRFLVPPLVIRGLTDAEEEKKRSPFQNLMFLAITIAVFMMLDIVSFSGTGIVMLVGVLLIHELGHWLGMKAFGYRDVRMFFIPMLGAAVSGRQTHASAVKRCVVSLLGPVPGLIIGTGLGFAYLMNENEELLRLARIFLWLNAFNLLPLHPLDGARVLEEVLFSRNAKVEVGFKLLTGLGLLCVAGLLVSPILGIFAVLMLVALPYTYRTARIAQAYRPMAVGPDLNQDRIPDEHLLGILEAASDAQRDTKQNDQLPGLLARQCTEVWDRVRTVPPGTLATVAILLVYGVSLLYAIVSPFALEVVVIALEEPVE